MSSDALMAYIASIHLISLINLIVSCKFYVSTVPKQSTVYIATFSYIMSSNAAGGEIPSGDVKDNDYVSRSGQYQIPVQKDEAPVEDPIDSATADSDETLGMQAKVS